MTSENSVALVGSVTLAKRLGIRPQTLRRWRQDGISPPFIKIGKASAGRVLYDLEEVKRWLSRRTVRSPEEEES